MAKDELKLNTVAEEIQAILKREDMAGIVILHLPLQSRYIIEFEPSYSTARMVDGELHPFAGVKETKDAVGTAEMFTVLQETAAMITTQLIGVVEFIRKTVKVKAELITHKKDLNGN